MPNVPLSQQRNTTSRPANRHSGTPNIQSSALYLSGSADNTIRIWTLATTTSRSPSASPSRPHRSCTMILKGHTDCVTALTTLHGPSDTHHSFIASGSRDMKVIVWDIMIGLPVRILEGHTGTVTSLHVSLIEREPPNGNPRIDPAYIYRKHHPTQSPTSTLDNERSGNATSSADCKPPLFMVESVPCPSPLRLLSGSYDSTVRVWDVDGIIRDYRYGNV